VTASCEGCPFPCASCLNYTYCASCLTSYYLFGSRCFSSCPLGYYPDNSSSCLSCPAHCQSCSSAALCSYCATNYYLLNGTCATACPLGMYPGTQALTSYDECQACQSDCANCTAYDYCATCLGSLIQFNGLCLSSCPIFYYSLNGSVCAQCSSYCTTCLNATYCTACIGSYLYLDACVASCPAQTYPSAGTSCNPCLAPCWNCTGDFTCTSCLSSFIYFHSYCVSSCPADVWYYPSNNSCNANCPYNKLTSNMTCFLSNCGTHMVALNGYCLSECGGGYYVDENQECVLCENGGGICKALFRGDLQIVYSDALQLVLYFSQAAELASASDISIQFVDIDGASVSYNL
jgi:hypothetical protein